MEAVEIIQRGSVTVSLYHDDDCASPREQDNVSVIYGRSRHYTIGDGLPPPAHERAVERGGAPLLERYLRLCEGCVAFELVGMIDHSGISFYAGGGAHLMDPGGWDSGTVGYTYTTRARCEELGVTLENARQAMLSELKEYASWSEGDCWGYTVVDDEGEHLDSCWGFIGYDYAKEEALGAADYYPQAWTFVDAAPVEEAVP
jgi:hypothetical protein